MKVHVSALFSFAKGAWEIHCILVLFIWDTGIFSRNKLELESWALQYPYQPVCLSLSIYLSISLGTEYICEIIHKTPIGQGSRGPYVSLEMFFYGILLLHYLFCGNRICGKEKSKRWLFHFVSSYNS